MPSSPAHAHDELIGSDPAADSALDALPAQLTLTFSAEIADDEGASVVEVTDAAGTSLAAGAPAVQDNVLTQPLAGEASGAVTVLWKVVSSDGHPISGEFAFTVEAAPTPTATTTPEPTATASEAASPQPPPSVTSEPVADSGSNALPWIIAGLLAAALLGAIVYLLVSRARREKALEHAAAGPDAGAAQSDSAPPADR